MCCAGIDNDLLIGNSQIKSKGSALQTDKHYAVACVVRHSLNRLVSFQR